MDSGSEEESKEQRPAKKQQNGKQQNGAKREPLEASEKKSKDLVAKSKLANKRK